MISQHFYQIYFSKNEILVGGEERYTNEINVLIYLIVYTFSNIGVVLSARKAVHFMSGSTTSFRWRWTHRDSCGILRQNSQNLQMV